MKSYTIGKPQRLRTSQGPETSWDIYDSRGRVVGAIEALHELFDGRWRVEGYEVTFPGAEPSWRAGSLSRTFEVRLVPWPPQPNSYEGALQALKAAKKYAREALVA
tara:strand:+ start:152 stop:469 length:318 start_codon:yes stop_codon:yes gene_type:complete